MKLQSVFNQASIASLHVNSMPARPRGSTTHRPCALSHIAQSKYPEFLATPKSYRTRTSRCSASPDTTTAPPEVSPQGIYANIDFRFDVKDICELTVSGSLDGAASAGASAAVALHNYYYKRSNLLARAVINILENADKALKTKLERDIDVNTLLQQLKDSPTSSLKLVDSLKLLMTLCQSTAPSAAHEIEEAIYAEYAKLKEKDAAGHDVNTDTPSSVLAKNDLNLTEGGSGSGESARQAPVRKALKLASGPFWDTWKSQLRSALIASNVSQTTPEASKPPYKCTFGIETRTSDDVPMKAWLNVVAGGSPALESIATKGPSQDADPALKNFLLLQFLQYPESSMLDSIAGLCWKVAQLPKPEKFRLAFSAFTSSLSSSSKSEKSGNTDEAQEGAVEAEKEFVIEGSGKELRVLLMVLAELESGELDILAGGQSKRKKALTQWMPVDGRIQVRRLKNGTSYEMRAALHTEGKKGTSNQAGMDSVVLSQRQIRAVIDCLDAFCELHPSFGLIPPKVDWPKTPLLAQVGATLKAGIF